MNSFKPGRQIKVFSKEFDANDKCIWTVVLPGGNVITKTSSVNFSHCTASDITSKYAFPRNGKQTNSKIGADLISLYNLYKSGVSVSSDELFRISNDGTKVLIEISSTDISSLVTSYKLNTDDIKYRNSVTIVVYFPIASLTSLNNNKTVKNVIPVYTPVTNSDQGLIISQGDKALVADWVRDAYQLDGAGVKVGVISDSYNNKGSSPDEVPASGVQIIKEYPYGTGSDEGRAMLEIVHDIAPGAMLAFRTGFLGPQDMANGIMELKNAGCQIIVDDVTYVTEPFFEDGIVADAINSIVGTTTSPVTYLNRLLILKIFRILGRLYVSFAIFTQGFILKLSHFISTGFI